MIAPNSAREDGAVVQSPKGGVIRLLRRDWKALLCAAVLTILVQLGFYALGRLRAPDDPGSLMAFLAVVILWCGIAPACFATGGETAWSSVIRGGCVADATCISLLVVWLVPRAGASLDFMAVVKLYCICASMAIAACAAVSMFRSAAKRCAAAVLTAVFFIVLLSSPLLVNARLENLPSDSEAYRRTAAVSVGINPFFAACDAVVDSTGFHWSTAEWMYTHTSLGENAAPGEVGWYWICLALLGLSGALGAAGVARYYLGRQASSIPVEQTP